MSVNLSEVRYISETSITIRKARRRMTIPKEIVARAQPDLLLDTDEESIDESVQKVINKLSELGYILK